MAPPRYAAAPANVVLLPASATVVGLVMWTKMV